MAAGKGPKVYVDDVLMYGGGIMALTGLLGFDHVLPIIGGIMTVAGLIFIFTRAGVKKLG